MMRKRGRSKQRETGRLGKTTARGGGEDEKYKYSRKQRKEKRKN
jgi:hypothetical protein